MAELSNQRFKYLDCTTRHSSATPEYFQQVGERKSGTALSPGQIGKTCQHIGEFFEPFNNQHNRGCVDNGILHDYHHRCRAVYIWFSSTWRNRLFNIDRDGLMVGSHYLTGKEILNSIFQRIKLGEITAPQGELTT